MGRGFEPHPPYKCDLWVHIDRAASARLIRRHTRLEGIQHAPPEAMVCRVRDPGQGAWRVIRGGVMTLVCCVLALSGHDAFRDLGRASAIVVLGMGVLGLSLWMVGRQMSFPRLAGLSVIGQLAIHGLLGVTIDRPVPGEVWTYHAHLPALGWMLSAQTAAGVLEEDLLITLLVAAILCGGEYNIWAWFRRAARRLVVAPPQLIPLPTPDAPTLQPVCAAPTFAPLFCVSGLGRRGPPATALA